MKTTIAVGVLFAAIRIWMGFTMEPTHADPVDVYKDMVHLYMGGLFVAIRYEKLHRAAYKGNSQFFWQRWLFWSLCVVEVAVAVFQRI